MLERARNKLACLPKHTRPAQRAHVTTSHVSQRRRSFLCSKDVVVDCVNAAPIKDGLALSIQESQLVSVQISVHLLVGLRNREQTNAEREETHPGFVRSPPTSPLYPRRAAQVQRARLQSRAQHLPTPGGKTPGNRRIIAGCQHVLRFPEAMRRHRSIGGQSWPEK